MEKAGEAEVIHGRPGPAEGRSLFAPPGFRPLPGMPGGGGAPCPAGGVRPIKKEPREDPGSSSKKVTGAPERIRTSDPQIRSLVLYPAELRALASGGVITAGGGGRNRGSDIFLQNLLFSTGKQQDTARKRTGCREAAQAGPGNGERARRGPETTKPGTGPGFVRRRSLKKVSAGAPGKIRTPNPQIRSLVLCPVELRAPASGGGDTSLPRRPQEAGGLVTRPACPARAGWHRPSRWCRRGRCRGP